MSGALEYKITLEQQQFFTAIDKSVQKMMQLEQKFKDVQKYAEQFAAQLKAQFEKVQETIKKLQDGIDELRNVALKAFTAIVALNSIPIKLFANFEEGMNKIATISTQNKEKIAKDIKDMAASTGTDVSVLQEAFYQTVSSIGDVAGATEFLRIANMNAKAGFTDTVSSVDALSSIINAYGMEVSEAARVSDLMIMTQNLGKTTVNELAKCYSNVIPLASVIGVKFEEISAAMATMTAIGIPTSEATTKLRSLFDELSKSGTKVADKFTQLSGKTFSSFIKSGGTVGEALQILEKNAKASGIEINNLFGSSEAGAAAIALSGTHAKTFAEFLKAMGESAGATQKAFDELKNGLNFRFAVTLQKLKVLAIDYGETFKNQLGGIFDKVDEVIDKFTEWFELNKDAIRDVAIFAVKVSGLALAFLSVAKAVLWLLTPVGLATTAIFVLAAAWYLNIGGIRDKLDGLAKFVINHPFLSMFLGFTTWKLSKLVFNYSFALIGETLKKSIDKLLIEAGLTMGAVKVGAAAAGLAVLAGFAIGVKISIMSGGAKDIEDYLNKIKEGLRLGIQEWKNNKIGVLWGVYDALFPGYRDFIKNLTTKWTSDFKAWFDNNLGLGKLNKMFNITFDDFTPKISKKTTGVTKGFDTGGYTGHGAKYDVAGVVHKGEYVIPAWMTQENPQMIAGLERIRRGFANGFWGGGTDKHVSINRATLDKANIKNQDLKITLDIIGDHAYDTKHFGQFVQMSSYPEKALLKAMKEYAATEKDVLATRKELKDEAKIGTGNKEKKGDKKGKEDKDLYDFKEEEKKFFRLNDGMGISRTSDEFYEEYHNFLDSSLKRMIVEGQSYAKVADLIKQNSNEYLAILMERSEKEDNDTQQAAIDELKKRIAQEEKEKWEKFDIGAKIDEDINFDADLGKEFDTWAKGEGKKARETLANEVTAVGTAIGNVAKYIDSDFLNILSSAASSISGFLTAQNTFNLGGLANQFAGGLGMASAIMGGIDMINGVFDEKTDKENAEQNRIYEENTKALEKLSETMTTMSDNFIDIGQSILSNLSKNPTLGRITESSNTYSQMLRLMDENKHFGNVSFMAEWKKDRKIGKDKTSQKTFAWGENIDGYSFEQLKEYRKMLNGVNNNTFAAIAQGNGKTSGGLEKVWDAVTLSGKWKFQGIKSSNFDEYKANIDKYLESYEKLLKEQERLLETSTLESFDGIEKITENELRDSYTKMFKDMGLDPEKFKNDIEEMVKANSILITATDDVRKSFISTFAAGESSGKAMLNSMAGYFAKFFNNISSIMYDTVFSDFDSAATEYFKKFSDKLVELKKNGGSILDGIKEFINGADSTDFLKKLVDTSKLNQNLDEVMRVFREKLKALGLTDSDIDALGIVDSTRKKLLEVIESAKGALNDAIGAALDNGGSVVSFKKALGKSIYDSAKSSLIKAFSESAVYQNLFKKWFEVKDISFTGNLEQDLKTMQDMLNELNGELIRNGLDHTSDDGSGSSAPKETSKTYYNPAKEDNSVTVVNNNYHFHFENAHVYDETGFENKVRVIHKKIKEEV